MSGLPTVNHLYSIPVSECGFNDTYLYLEFWSDKAWLNNNYTLFITIHYTRSDYDWT